MQKILIFTPKISPRIQYIFDFILQDFSGIDYEITTNIQFFEASEKIKINYSDSEIPNSFFLKSDNFLFESGTNNLLNFSDLNKVGQCFFALSRYEEYQIQKKDHHQRISGKKRVYKTPFVDEWILQFQSEFQEKYPEIKFKKREFSLWLSCDVDQTWKYKHKGFKRRWGANIRDLVQLNFKEILKRETVISGKEKDPFDTFDYFKSLHDSKKVDKLIFFWLLGNYGKFDKNNPVNNSFFQQKISEISAWAESGLHPSYASNSNFNQLKIEKKRLENILNFPVKKSRQHYLKLNLPETYQNLLAAGITEDYSMAYADETGFRAGTCTPFYWYDLEKEKKTELKIYPFCAMEVSMRNYMQLNPEEAIAELQRLKHEIRKVKGNMTVLFHNSNLTEEWKDWKKVLDSITK